MTTFKVRSCGNSPSEALYRAQADDGIEKKNSGIQKVERLLELDEDRIDKLLQNWKDSKTKYMKEILEPKVAYWTSLKDGEYEFTGVVVED